MEERSQDEPSDTETQVGMHTLYENEDTDWTRIQPFGAGLKRKRVHFVRATDASNTSEQAPSTPKKPSSNVSDLYLSRVMRSGGKSNSTPSSSNSTSSAASESAAPPSCSEKSPPLQERVKDVDETISEPPGTKSTIPQDDFSQQNVIETNKSDDLYCSICDARITTDMKTHVRSIVHMYNEGHSDVPHHFNRKSEGFKHMVDLGWNPDERQGLGPDGLGIRYPVRVLEKNDKLGIGAGKVKISRSTAKDVRSVERTKPMSVKDLRKLEIVEREKRKSLHEYLSR